jgi:hypothetical protein
MGNQPGTSWEPTDGNGKKSRRYTGGSLLQKPVGIGVTDGGYAYPPPLFLFYSKGKEGRGGEKLRTPTFRSKVTPMPAGSRRVALLGPTLHQAVPT